MVRSRVLTSCCIMCLFIIVQIILHLTLRLDAPPFVILRDLYTATRNPLEHKPFLAVVVDLAYPSLLLGAMFVRYAKPTREYQSAVFSVVVASVLTLLQLFYASLIGRPTPWIGASSKNYVIDLLICTALCAFAIFGSRKALQEAS